MYMRHPPPAHPVKLYQIAGLALACAATTAAADVHFEEDAFFEPLPVVLTASRLPQSLPDAPGAMTVLDRELIDATGYRDLPRLLRFVPGMHIGYERGHATWVSYHGLGLSFPGEMQVLVDGAQAHVPTDFGAIAWSQLPIFVSEIERIEVVRGASANSFGASALLGTVNLITRAGSEAPGSYVRSQVGDGIRDIEAGWSNGSQPLSLRMVAGEQTDNGFTGLHDHRTTQRLSLRAESQLGANHQITARLSAAREWTGRGYAASPFDSNAIRDANNRSHTLHLQWRYTTDVEREWMLSLYHHALENTDRWLGDGAGFTNIPISRDRKDRRTSVELQRLDRWTSTLRGVWGVHATVDDTTAPLSFSKRGSIHERHSRAFGNLEWQPADPLRINIGIAADDHDGQGWRLNPRLYGNYRASPVDTLRVGASRTWRHPVTFERHGDVQVFDPASGLLLARPYIPNPALQSTRADTFEIGYIRQFSPWRSVLDVRLFEEQLHDLIVRTAVTPPAPTPVLNAAVPTTQQQNSDATVVLRGIELQLETRPARNSTVRLAYSLIHRNANDAAVESGIAPYTAHLSWQQDWPARWSSMLSVTRVGPVASGDSFLANGRYVVDAFTTLDLTVSRRFSLGGHPARFTLAALNLGPRHQEIADPAMQLVYGTVPANTVSRQVYAGLDVRF